MSNAAAIIRETAPPDALGYTLLARPLAPGLDVRCVLVVYDDPPTIPNLRALLPRLGAAPGTVRPGVDYWRQWATEFVAAPPDGPPPVSTFLTVTDPAGWAARRRSGDHAFDCLALHAACDRRGTVVTLLRTPRPRDLVLSPEEGVLTFQQIVAELVLNHGMPTDGTDRARRLRTAVDVLAEQTMRNALALVGDPMAFALTGPALAQAFARAYPHWPLGAAAPDTPLPERLCDVVAAFERIAEEIETT